MKHEIEAWTDAATVALFDPAALPEDFDARLAADPAPFLEREGPALWIPCPSGHACLHVYEDEDAPEALKTYLRNPQTREAFATPSGQLFLTGAEDAFRNDEGRRKRHVDLGNVASVRAGRWSLTLYECAIPPGMTQRAIRTGMSPGAYFLTESIKVLVPLAILAFFGLAASFFGLRFSTWATIALPLGLALVAAPLLLGRLKVYREADARRREIQRSYPSLVAVLKRLN